MAGKNPFGPEDKTAPSRRNPVLDAKPTRPAVPVVEVATPPASFVVPPPPSLDLPPAGHARRPTDDTAGPSTPRPGLSMETVPRIVMSPARIRALPLDPRDAFLLTHIDGDSDLRTIIDVTGMTRLEVTRVIEKLADLGAIEVV